MKNSFKVTCDNAINIENGIIEVDNKEGKGFVTYKEDTITFQEINFYDIEFLSLYDDKIFLQYYISDDNQTNFKKEVNSIKINDKKYDLQDIKKLEFKNCEFHNMYIEEKFSKHLCLNNCYIKGVLNFSNNNSIEGKNLFLEFSTFKNQVILQKSSFNELLLQNSIFLSFVNFTEVKIKEPLDLTSISFKEFANFLGIQCSVKNRETARIIKNSFEQQKNIIEANKFYVAEMQKMEEELKLNENPLDWIVFKIHKISSNHSQDWMLVLFWILSLTFLYSGFKQKYCSVCSGCDQLMLYSLLSISSIIVFIESIVLLESKKINKFIVFLIFNIINYACYSIVTDDYQLLCVIKIFYLFSQLSENSHFPLLILIYKIFIAYLIYQLIISVRQNTRRK